MTSGKQMLNSRFTVFDPYRTLTGTHPRPKGKHPELHLARRHKFALAMGVGLGKDDFLLITSCLPRNLQFSGSNLRRRAACYEGGKLRFRRSETERLGEDHCGRPKFWTQRLQRYESLHVLLGRMRRPFKGLGL
jgi:hypothetical protein